MITIRSTAEADVPILLDIQKAAFQPIYEIYHDAGNPALRGMEDITRRLHPPFRQFTILEDGEIVGGIFYVTEGSTPHVPCLAPGEYYLGRLYIRPDRQSHGIGRHAILLCEQTFPDARKFYVDFPRELDKNRRCYEAAGFRSTGTVLTPEPGLTLLLYDKQVSQDTAVH